jgi:Mce-associated membrane protein
LTVCQDDAVTHTSTFAPAGPGGPVRHEEAPVVDRVDPRSLGYASWTRRVVGTLLDLAIFSGATWLVLGLPGTSPSLAPGIEGADPPGTTPVPWTSSPLLVLLVVAMLAVQGYTGATPGKRVAGVAVVRADTRLPAGFLVAALRVLAHLLDTIFLVGYLRPLWHRERRTFADSVVGTVAVQTREPAPHPWFAPLRRAPSAARSTVVSVAAGLVCALGVGFSTMTASSGGSDLVVDARCTFDDAGPGVAPTAVSITLDEWWSTESRLWVSRELPQEPSPVDARWEWFDPRPGTQQVRLEATITDRQGRDPFTAVQEEAEPVISSGGEQVPTDTARVPGQVVARYPGGWAVTTRMLVDGAEVASCSTTDDGEAAAPDGSRA